jgi:hypothetical protein
MCHHFDLAIPNLRDCYRVSEVADTIVDLDFVVEEFLECGQIEDLVADGLGAIDSVLRPQINLNLAMLSAIVEHTFFVTLAGLPFCIFTQSLAYCSKCQYC